MKQKIMKTPFAINLNIKAPIVYTFASNQSNGRLYKTSDNGLTIDMYKYSNVILYFQRTVKPTTFRLFIYITYLCADNSNVIIISPKKTMSKMNICLSAFYNAIEDLVKYNIIAKTNIKNTYIINHRILFNSELSKFYEDYKRLYPDQEGEIF